MSKPVSTLFYLALAIFFMGAGCSRPAGPVIELRHYPIDSLEDVITRTDVGIDKVITSDGNGSLMISANRPATIHLVETGDIDVENARLIYQAKLRTEGVEGKAYLEMWCQFTGKGEFFSRNPDSPLSGSTNWSTQETPFFLQKGENPDNVKLNLVIEGKGTVWVDDIHLFKGPLQ